MVHNGKNGIVSVGLREADDEVHGYLLKRKGGGVRGDLVHRRASAMCDDLILLARHTPLDVLRDPHAHVGPPVTSLGLGDGFVAPRVSGNEAFVHHSHDFSFNREVWGNR